VYLLVDDGERERRRDRETSEVTCSMKKQNSVAERVLRSQDHSKYRRPRGSGKLGVEPLSVCNRARLPQSVVCSSRPEHEEPISNRLHVLLKSSNVQRVALQIRSLPTPMPMLLAIVLNVPSN
jgi:hypothetical protein